MTPEPRTRDKGIIVPSWFLLRIIKLVDEDERSLVEIAAALTAVADRDSAWDHGAVSKFLNNKVTTDAMADAFASLYGVPRPFYEARTEEEAISLQATAKRYDAVAVTPDQKHRLAVADQLRDTEQEAAGDQTHSVDSQDERARRGRRTGRTARRGA
jgi:hypothetical protein